MPSKARLENIRVLIVKNSKILKKKYAEQSEAKKIRLGPKMFNFGASKLGSKEGAQGVPPGSATGVYPSMHLGRGCVDSGGLCAGDVDRGVWIGGVHPPMMVTEAGGTHPTGMHTCFLFVVKE